LVASAAGRVAVAVRKRKAAAAVVVGQGFVGEPVTWGLTGSATLGRRKT
jgi:hypothetical protein